MTQDQQDMHDLKVGDFLEQLWAKQPTPGGGSVAGLAASMAVGLARMSLNYSKGKKQFADAAEQHEHLSARLEKASAFTRALTVEDAEAFALYQQSASLPDGQDKDSQAQVALAAAINVPKELAKLCLSLLEDLHRLRPICTSWLLSDLKAAGAMAVAAVTICEYNIRTNASQLEEDTQRDELIAGAQADVRAAQQSLAALEYRIDRT